MTTVSAPMPAAAATVFEACIDELEDDIALGCECAYPALQIDCWGSESIAPAPAVLVSTS